MPAIGLEYAFRVICGADASSKTAPMPLVTFRVQKVHMRDCRFKKFASIEGLFVTGERLTCAVEVSDCSFSGCTGAELWRMADAAVIVTFSDCLLSWSPTTAP